MLSSAREGNPAAQLHTRTPSTKALLVLLACSAVLLIACLPHLEAAPEAMYGLVCGAVSALPVLLLLLAPDKLPAQARAILYLVLFLMWFAAVGACTFHRPFTQTGNGYFAVWGGLICTLKLAAEADHRWLGSGSDAIEGGKKLAALEAGAPGEAPPSLPPPLPAEHRVPDVPKL